MRRFKYVRPASGPVVLTSSGGIITKVRDAWIDLLEDGSVSFNGGAPHGSWHTSRPEVGSSQRSDIIGGGSTSCIHVSFDSRARPDRAKAKTFLPIAGTEAFIYVDEDPQWTVILAAITVPR